VASRYETQRSYAAQAERSGDPLTAAAHVVLAAQAAPDHPAHLAAVGELQRLAEMALARAVREAHRAGYSWREIGAATRLAWQSLHRRYGARTRRASTEPRG
jgi:hypothetical protein